MSDIFSCERFLFGEGCHAVGNGSLALLTGERLIEAIGTARSCFLTADAARHPTIVTAEPSERALTLHCYAAAPPTDGRLRSSVTLRITATALTLLVEVEAIHDMTVTFALVEGMRTERVGEGKFRFRSPCGEVLRLVVEGSCRIDSIGKQLDLYAGRCRFAFSVERDPDAPRGHRLSDGRGGLLCFGRHLSLSDYCAILDGLVARREDIEAENAVGFLQRLYQRYGALPVSFLGDGSDGRLSKEILPQEQAILSLSRYYKTFGRFPDRETVSIAAKALSYAMSYKGLREALFLVSDGIPVGKRLPAVLVATRDQLKDRYLCSE